eukprot:scaffold3334_cov369-Prasinococcus_capsulatus_cf.AAC.14
MASRAERGALPDTDSTTSTAQAVLPGCEGGRSRTGGATWSCDRGPGRREAPPAYGRRARHSEEDAPVAQPPPCVAVGTASDMPIRIMVALCTNTPNAAGGEKTWPRNVRLHARQLCRQASRAAPASESVNPTSCWGMRPFYRIRRRIRRRLWLRTRVLAAPQPAAVACRRR